MKGTGVKPRPTLAPSRTMAIDSATKDMRVTHDKAELWQSDVMSEPNLERQVNHILERGVQFGDGVRLVVDVPARTSVGTVIPGVTDRFNLDTFDGLVWVHSNTYRTTYAATELDAARWLYMLEANT